MIYKAEHPEHLAPMFADCHDSAVKSCLQGVMGEIWVDDIQDVKSAMAIMGDFYFPVGEPNAELISKRMEKVTPEPLHIVPPNDAWADLIETVYGDEAQLRIRYSLRKDVDAFDREVLSDNLTKLSPEYTIRYIEDEEALYRACVTGGWCADLAINFPTYELFAEYGIGVVILKDGEIVAGASSFSAYKEGIEIQIITRVDYRRKGLARVASSALLLRCFEKGKYPNWDAENVMSRDLAVSLGYIYKGEYLCYHVQKR